ncbi:thaumatin family protein [Catenuloplanes sp. NPDC051500]|uniref:thaumatin family protein n=1 Tax=Catenuloplanes sp. NPDC051500 TaxID=3363959 RepID=UPI0037A21CC8
MPGRDSSLAARSSFAAVLTAIAVLLLAVSTLIGGSGDGQAGESKAQTSANHTVTFVNDSGEKVWVGSTVNADGSQNFGSLPILEPGQRATIEIPESSGPGHWRGKFFPRQQCTGESGSTFHCAVGDCGNAADHCAINSEQPVSLAEFNFDPSDALTAVWYNISYVNAVSLPITITPTGGPAPQEGSQHCGVAGCAKPFLPSCPAANLVRDDRGTPLNCINPNRDVETDYSRAVAGVCPKAYSWSKMDAMAGNQTMFECKECTGFTVTFHGNGTGQAPVAPAEDLRTGALADPDPSTTGRLVNYWMGKCLDAPNANFADGVHLQVWDCASTEAQRWAFVDGRLMGKGNLCMDIAWGSGDNGAAVQLAYCNGGPAQQWVLTDAGDVVNPQADKCLDIKDWNPENGAQLQIWECAGSVNQKWYRA